MDGGDAGPFLHVEYGSACHRPVYEIRIQPAKQKALVRAQSDEGLIFLQILPLFITEELLQEMAQAVIASDKETLRAAHTSASRSRAESEKTGADAFAKNAAEAVEKAKQFIAVANY